MMDSEKTENYELRVREHGIDSATDWARVRYGAEVAAELRFAYHQKGIDAFEVLARDMAKKGRRF